VTFEGNVVAVQADVTLHANRVHAEYSREAKAIERIEAEGDVRVVQGDREARAPRATFFNLEQRVVLSGGADLRQGENTLKGETLTLYLRENRSVVTGGEGGGRVRAVINPKGVMEKSPK
jgi:lipopolysaccharide export system protein LptA